MELVYSGLETSAGISAASTTPRSIRVRSLASFITRSGQRRRRLLGSLLEGRKESLVRERQLHDRHHGDRPLDGGVYCWALDREEDLNGNAIEYTYQQPAGTTISTFRVFV